MKKYTLAIVLGLLIALIVWISQGLLSSPLPENLPRILSDGLFLAGVLIAGLGVLGIIAGKSQNMGLKFLVYRLGNVFHKNKNGTPPMNYGEFHASRLKDSRSLGYLLIPGMVFIALATLLMFMGTRDAETIPPVAAAAALTQQNNQTEDTMEQNPIFTITLENGQVMTGELYPRTAPESVGNFVALANASFYDGLIFHRVIPGFMIQGGCPDGTGMGGPGYSIKGEFSQNGVSNPLKHTKGVLSMARSMRMDSAGSQFFIMVADAPHLNGGYAAFGKVLTGMEAADQIVATSRNSADRPLTDQVIKSIRVETFGVDYPFTRLGK